MTYWTNENFASSLFVRDYCRDLAYDCLPIYSIIPRRGHNRQRRAQWAVHTSITTFFLTRRNGPQWAKISWSALGCNCAHTVKAIHAALCRRQPLRIPIPTCWTLNLCRRRAVCWAVVTLCTHTAAMSIYIAPSAIPSSRTSNLCSTSTSPRSIEALSSGSGASVNLHTH